MLAEIDADGWVKIIGAIGLIVVSYFQWRMWMTVNTIEKQTNHLAELAQQGAHAKGVIQGQVQEKEREAKAEADAKDCK